MRKYSDDEMLAALREAEVVTRIKALLGSAVLRDKLKNPDFAHSVVEIANAKIAEAQTNVDAAKQQFAEGSITFKRSMIINDVLKKWTGLRDRASGKEPSGIAIGAG